MLVAAPGSALAPRHATLAALVAALAVGLVLAAAPPVLSGDVFRYLWDGRVSLSGVDPYRHAPSDPALAALRDDAWARINHPDIATIYPPLAQVLFALGAATGGGVTALKLLALAAHLTTIPLVARLAGPERAGKAALLFALNPLALAESALGGHVDAAAGLAIAAAVLALARARPMRSALLVAAAVGTKLVGLLLLPLLGARNRAALAVAAVLCATLLAPVLSAGGGAAPPGAREYAVRWRGNEGLYAPIEGGIGMIVGALAERTGSAPGRVVVPTLRPLLEALAQTRFDPWASVVGEKKDVPSRIDLPLSLVSSTLARVLVAALVLALGVFLSRRSAAPLPSARLLVLAALLLSPQLHPWYVLWLLPLEVACGGAAGLVLSLTVLVAYAPLPGWEAERTWVEAPLARLLEHGLVLGVLIWERPLRLLGGRSPVRGAYTGAGEPSSPHRGPSQCTPSPSR